MSERRAKSVRRQRKRKGPPGKGPVLFERKKPMKWISFTVPCYNSAAYMDKAIESLLPGGEDVEIIIIDDGSKDETGAIADRYAEKYPSIIKVVHQENGGHGEGINQGIAHATGKYFKVLDSDDWVDQDAYRRVLAKLKELGEDGCDLMVCNYYYEHADGKGNRAIKYDKVFPEGRVVGWEETKRFPVTSYLTLHSCIFRTQILHDCGVHLPKKIFYEDNLFVYTPLPYIKRVCYLDVDFYRYFIGREGQSVSEQAMMKRCSHQNEIAVRVFAAHDLEKVKAESPQLAHYMYQECRLMLIIASVFTRLNRDEEHEKIHKEMWDKIEEINPKLGKRLRWRSFCTLLNLPGVIGREIGLIGYKIAHLFVRFN